MQFERILPIMTAIVLPPPPQKPNNHKLWILHFVLSFSSYKIAKFTHKKHQQLKLLKLFSKLQVCNLFPPSVFIKYENFSTQTIREYLLYFFLQYKMLYFMGGGTDVENLKRKTILSLTLPIYPSVALDQNRHLLQCYL